MLAASREGQQLWGATNSNKMAWEAKCYRRLMEAEHGVARYARRGRGRGALGIGQRKVLIEEVEKGAVDPSKERRVVPPKPHRALDLFKASRRLCDAAWCRWAMAAGSSVEDVMAEDLVGGLRLPQMHGWRAWLPGSLDYKGLPLIEERISTNVRELEWSCW
ncbi:hypothetical protein BHE74_00004265 [Ensete ventricosum]|nr:hypothetical protein BHE74_00004265 [Ensete ventricosum]